MDMMLYLVNALGNAWSQIRRPARVLIAFSGGADSTALLHALHALSLEQNALQLTAVHINHGVRPDADADEAFARETCAHLKVPFHSIRLHLVNPSEDDMRQARYDALFDIAKQEGISVIALAHHMQDQAETVLMRLMRGSADGLKGMESAFSVQHKKDTFLLWRPFLQIAPGMLRQALQQAHITWREDASNRDTHYLRNFVRHDLLPMMEARAAQVVPHLANTAAVLQDESHFLDTLAETWLSEHACCEFPCPFLAADAFFQLHPAMQKRVMRRFLKISPMDAVLSYDTTCQACAMQAGDTVNLPHQFRLYHAGKRIHLLPAVPPACALAPLQCVSAPHGSDGIHYQAIPAALWEKATLRTRLPGDFIQPFGSAGHKSLQDYMVDQKIDRPFRDHMPLLCIGQEVIWVIGAGASEKARVQSDTLSVMLYYPARLPMEYPQHLTKEN